MTPWTAFAAAFAAVCVCAGAVVCALAGAVVLWAAWQTREAMGMDSTERE